jgi:hypothetical protein
MSRRLAIIYAAPAKLTPASSIPTALSFNKKSNVLPSAEVDWAGQMALRWTYYP